MKKVLIISYFFPPLGGGGVIRVTKFVKYLPQFGWQPFVLTVKKGFYPIEDKSLLEEIPRDAKITRVEYFEPAFWFKNKFWQSFLSYLIYPLFLIPDRQILWLLPAVLKARKIIKEEKIDIIFTTFAPASDHLIGLVLKKLTSVKWVADFRDEWTISPDFKPTTIVHRWINHWLEKKILDCADIVVTVSAGLTKSYQEIQKTEANKFVTITNGFDKDDFRIENATFPKEYCQIVYAGSLYKNRQVELLKQVLTELNLRKIKLTLIGPQRRLPYAQAIKKIFEANIVLLILSPHDSEAVVTGKIYDYMAARKPILALAPNNSGAAQLIMKYQLGEIANPLDTIEIKRKLLKMYQKWLKNQLIIPQVNLEKYERKNLTENLARIFDKLTEKPRFAKNLRDSRRIRLCLIGNILSPQNQNLCRFFVQKGYDIHFITIKPGKITGVKTYFLGSDGFTSWYFVKSLYRIKKIIKGINPDIVHGQDLVFAGIWAYLSGFRPFVVTPWGSDVMNYNQFIGLEKILIKKTLQKADLATVSSNALQKQAEKIGLKKNTAQMIHFGIDLDIFKKKKTARSNIIFCPRAIGSIYNTDILIRAFAVIAQKNKDICLALLNNIADESYLLEIEKLIIKYNLVDKVLFWQKVPNERMVDYYNRADLIVSLSSSDGCSVSLLEAMACEKKIVATDLSYIREWWQDGNLWVVPVRDIKATASAIIVALKYPLSKWQKIGASNRQLVAEKAEINNNFEKLDNLYRKLIENLFKI